MAHQQQQQPNFPPHPQWQLNAFNGSTGSPAPGGAPIINGNGSSNLSSRTNSPAQMPPHPHNVAPQKMSGLVTGMQQMSMQHQQQQQHPNMPPRAPPPVNGNTTPIQPAAPLIQPMINGNNQHMPMQPRGINSVPAAPPSSSTTMQQQTNYQTIPQAQGQPQAQFQKMPPLQQQQQPTSPQQQLMGNNPRPPFPNPNPQQQQFQVPQSRPPLPQQQQNFQPISLPPIQQSQIPSPQGTFMAINANIPLHQQIAQAQQKTLMQQQQQQQHQQPQIPHQNQGPRPMYPPQQNFAQRPQVQSPLQHQQQQPHYNGYQQSDQQQKLQYQPQSVSQSGFNRLWGHDTVDLMQNRHILPPTKYEPPPIRLNHQFHEAVNCNPDIFRCTLNKVPESNSLLQKSRLPLGILIHPFRDLNNLPVITSSTIVRCRVCRTYINPFVYFVDSKKWKCNLCYRVNDLPDEFLFDPVSKTYGDPTRRPEVKSSTIEFIAPSEYTLRPPQPAIFLFLLDASALAQQSGYIQIVCDTILEQLDKLPGDTRKQIGFIAYNSAVHFYNIAENYNQPHEVTVLDLDDIFLPFPENLVVNLKACKELIKDLLLQLPKRFENNHDPYSSLGAALQAGYKLLSPTGGRITVFHTCLPNHGPGALQPREDPNNRSSKDIQHLGPATDFYKRLALECSGQQIAVDLFLLNSQYSDLATLSGISKFSGGCIYHFPLFNANKPSMVKSFKQCFERYLIRKIGFEAVMRVRCTRGLQIHTFHGNFFVRSTDLLSLPNINPDAGFGLQISYEESLTDVKTVCFQAALLYTSSNGERRIRVHTLCVPVSANLSEIMTSADVHCIIGLLTKMAVDRSLSSNLSDARDAFINATVDIITSYKLAQNLPASGGVLLPSNLALFPLYILSLLKQTAFRTGTSTRLDDRVFAMCEMKTLPLDQLIKYIYPDFYCIDQLFDKRTENGDKDEPIEIPPKLQLSAEHLDTRSIFCLDGGNYILLYIGSNVPQRMLTSVLGVSSINEVPEICYSIPDIKTPENEALKAFIDLINEDKPYAPIVQIIRDSTATRPLLTEKFIEDKNDSNLSYYEFLQHIKTQVK